MPKPDLEVLPPQSVAGAGRRCPIPNSCCRNAMLMPDPGLRPKPVAGAHSRSSLPDLEPLLLESVAGTDRLPPNRYRRPDAGTATSSLPLPRTLCCRVPDPVTAGVRALPAGTSCCTPAFEPLRRESLGSSGSGCRCGRQRVPWFRDCPPPSLRDSRFRSKDGECRAWMVSWNDPPEGYLRFVFLR